MVFVEGLLAGRQLLARENVEVRLRFLIMS